MLSLGRFAAGMRVFAPVTSAPMPMWRGFAAGAKAKVDKSAKNDEVRGTLREEGGAYTGLQSVFVVSHLGCISGASTHFCCEICIRGTSIVVYKREAR